MRKAVTFAAIIMLYLLAGIAAVSAHGYGPSTYYSHHYRPYHHYNYYHHYYPTYYHHYYYRPRYVVDWPFSPQSQLPNYHPRPYMFYHY